MQNNIYKILIKKDKSPTWLAGQLGMQKKCALYKWLENINQPNIFNLYKISQALGVPMEELICK